MEKRMALAKDRIDDEASEKYGIKLFRDYEYFKAYVHPKYPQWIMICGYWPKGYQEKPFKTTRKGRRKIKKMELDIQKAGFIGWLSWTDHDNTKMMSTLLGLHAKPYALDKERVFFERKVNHG